MGGMVGVRQCENRAMLCPTALICFCYILKLQITLKEVMAFHQIFIKIEHRLKMMETLTWRNK